jgi:hypothetical protein
MKIRILLTTILMLLLISGLSLSQESMSPEPNMDEPLLVEASTEPVQPEPRLQGPYAMETSEGPRSSRTRSSNDKLVTKIFMLKYFPVDDLGHLIADLFTILPNQVYSDSRSNRLIIHATIEQMNDIEALIEKLDVADSQLAASRAVENLVYRVYMFEIPSKDQGMKSFSMILQASGGVTSATLLSVAAKEKIEVSDFVTIDERETEQVEILLQGRAPSNESIQKIAELTGIQIKELKWDDETFTRSIGAARYSQLPAQMQKHLQKFLGENIVTVGYWFGSLSVPGEVKAPIGPWKLRLELESESDRELELRVEVEAPEQMSRFDRRLGSERANEILSNTIRAKVGKPIIIGYNRESYGTRKMGAMVIVPEADIIQLEENKK